MPRANRRARITSLGRYVPERVVTNADLEKIVNTNDEWIRTRTGIEQRRWAEPGTPTSELATKAVRECLGGSTRPSWTSSWWRR